MANVQKAAHFVSLGDLLRTSIGCRYLAGAAKKVRMSYCHNRLQTYADLWLAPALDVNYCECIHCRRKIIGPHGLGDDVRAHTSTKELTHKVGGVYSCLRSIDDRECEEWQMTKSGYRIRFVWIDAALQ
jgi:hypothetical protein